MVDPDKLSDPAVTSSTGDTLIPAPLDRGSPPLTKRLAKILSFSHKTFKDFWFYIAAISLVFNISYTFRPQIIVQAATTADNDPLATLFTITDQSAWAFYNVNMTCVIWNGDKKLATLSNNTIQNIPGAATTGNSDIDVLEAYKPVTQDCGTTGNLIHFSGLDPEMIKIDVMTSYDWLFGLRHKESNWHFTTRRVGAKFILVPDVERRFFYFRLSLQH